MQVGVLGRVLFWFLFLQARDDRENSDATSRPQVPVTASDADTDSSGTLGRSMTEMWAMLQTNNKMSQSGVHPKPST